MPPDELPSELTAFEHKGFEGVTGGDHELQMEISVLFNQQIKQMQADSSEAMRQLRDQHDAGSILIWFHTIRGLAASVCARRAEMLAKTAESGLLNRTDFSDKEIVADINNVVEQVQSALNEASLSLNSYTSHKKTD